MDLMTDLQIIQDLLDASSRRGVAVYAVLEVSGVSHFLDMCSRLQVNATHLRVRTHRRGGMFDAQLSHMTEDEVKGQTFAARTCGSERIWSSNVNRNAFYLSSSFSHVFHHLSFISLERHRTAPISDIDPFLELRLSS